MTLLSVLSAWVQAGGQANVSSWAAGAGGVLFIVLGNYMGKVSRNFFVGIRTPWILADDEVWLRTHRLGGKLYVLSGLLTIIASVVGAGIGMLVVSVVGSSLVSVVYSYVIYRKRDLSVGEGTRG